jgi:U3 small nucleolar ribonucleoprotein component
VQKSAANVGFPPTGDLRCPSESLLKTRVFERVKVDGKIRKKNGLYVSHNSFLISASQNVYSRLSLKRANHAEEKSEKRSGRPRRANEAVTCIL